MTVTVAYQPCSDRMDFLSIALERKQPFFANVFDSKKSNDNIVMPQSCFQEAELSTFPFRTGKVKKLLLELDPYDARPKGIFHLFFINP